MLPSSSNIIKSVIRHLQQKEITKKKILFINSSCQKVSIKQEIKPIAAPPIKKIHIVYIFIGKLPSYIRESIQQVRYWTTPETIIQQQPIYVITDDPEADKILMLGDNKNNVTIIPFDHTLRNDPRCELMYKYRDQFAVVQGLTNREHLFFYSMVRFVILEAFMRLHNLGCDDNNHVFHLEIDNLIYFNPIDYDHVLFQKPLAFLIDSFRRGSAGLFFVKNIQGLNLMNNALFDYICNKKGIPQEMIFLGNYHACFPDEVMVLPCIVKNDQNSLGTLLSENYDLFVKSSELPLIFDPASIGIIFTGEDAFHTKGILRKGFGHHNVNTPVDYSKYILEWEYNGGGAGLKSPILKDGGVCCKIANLHIHSKDLLCNMSGVLPKPDDMTFASGEFFYAMCDMHISDQDSIFTEKKEIDNPTFIYIHGHSLHKLLQLDLDAIFKNKFVLISHNSDIMYNGGQLLPFKKLITLFSGNNLSPFYHLLPLGIANSYWPHGDKKTLEKVMNMNIHAIPNKIYFYFELYSNVPERLTCVVALRKKGLQWGTKAETYEKYLLKIKKCEYVICPVGNGIDTHRFWETIYLGRIPVVIDNPLIQKLRPYFKMIILRDWSDFNYGCNQISMPNQSNYPFLWFSNNRAEMQKKFLNLTI